MQYLGEKENATQDQQYILARYKMRKLIEPPQKYAYVDLIAYALNMIEKNREWGTSSLPWVH